MPLNSVRRPAIFVSIASYRDPDLGNTVRDLFAQATHPDRIRVGVCLQRVPGEDRDCGLPGLRSDQVRVIEVHAAASRGACWARSQIQSLWQGEDYYFQIDSHMRFAPGWDETLLALLAACPAANTVLSTYPLPFTPPDQLSPPQLVTITPNGFDARGVLSQNSTASSLDEAPSAPAEVAFIAAGMLFAPGRIVAEVPYDPLLYFEGEEISLAVRLWTRGWELRQPNRVVAYHNYEKQPERPRHWADQTDWTQLNETSRQRLRHLLGIEPGQGECLRDIQRFGLGTARSLAEYQVFSGLDFRARLYRGKPLLRPDAAANAEGQRQSRKKAFTQIWQGNGWGNAETRSGSGSTRAATAGLREWLQRTLPFLGVRILADAGCGDLNWMRDLAPSQRFYFGYDIVDGLVDDLRQRFSSQRQLNFATTDIVTDVLPEADAILCRDCLTHLSLDGALMALRAFRESGARYLLASTHDTGSNTWTPDGHWHPIDLTASPFNLPRPQLQFTEHGGKHLGVWSRDELPA